MDNRLSRILVGVWTIFGLFGAGFVVFMVARGSDPITSDVLAIGGGVWFTVLSFWAAYVSKLVTNLENRIGERLDRMEKRLSDQISELREDLKEHIRIGHP